MDLSPLVSALRVHEGHLNVVSSVCLVVFVPLQPTMHLAAQIVSHSLLRLVRPLLSHQRFPAGIKIFILDLGQVTSSALDFHSPMTLSKFLPRFSVMMAAAWTRSYSMEISSKSACILDLDFSALAILAWRESTVSSASAMRAWSLLRAISSSSTRPKPSVSYLDLHS